MTLAERVNPSSGSAAQPVSFWLSRQEPTFPSAFILRAFV
jgi:hypothetical protein